MLWTIAFWKGAGERLIKTFFQTFAALITADATGIGATIGIADLDWVGMLSIAGVAAIASLATSIANPEFVSGFQNELPSKVNLTGQVVELGGDEYVLVKSDGLEVDVTAHPIGFQVRGDA